LKNRIEHFSKLFLLFFLSAKMPSVLKYVEESYKRRESYRYKIKSNHCALCTQPSIPFEAICEVEGRKWKLNRTEKAQRISFPSVS